VSRAAAIALALLAGLVACSDAPRSYPAHGLVRDVDHGLGQVVIAHDEVEGLMEAMTMSFDVADPSLLEGLEPGEVVDFTILFDGRSYRISEIVRTGRRAAAEEGVALAGVVDVADPAPDFELTDQDGRPLSLGSLRGKRVLLDFVYTSCPGPCPILTATHVAVQRRLPPELRESTRFVSISIDPERDTPEALRAYAEARGADLSGWSFLTGPPDLVAAVVGRYGVGSVRAPDGEIEHVVATFLIDPEGRIVRRYLGLDHDADELLADLARIGAG
jgi:protein SCO1/2